MAERDDTFGIDRRGRLVRSVVPARGKPYQHTCDLDVLTEVSHLAGELDGFTIEDLAERTGFPSSQVATALAFLKERGIVATEARRNYAATGDAHLDAMTEYHALREASGGSPAKPLRGNAGWPYRSEDIVDDREDAPEGPSSIE